jgi:DNA-binding MarR family transcriptional regulator
MNAIWVNKGEWAMREAVRTDEDQSIRIVLGLLESVERDGERSQRKLAAELGVALGLVNAYLKRCVAKGLVKMRAVPTRRYAYYLTPKGFAEKSRLSVDYFSTSFSFFRRARADCSAVLEDAAVRGSRTVALLGISDLAEIAIICALEAEVSVTAIVDSTTRATQFMGIPVVSSMKLMPISVGAVVVTDLRSAQAVANAAAKTFGRDRVLVPALLKVNIGSGNEAVQ